MVPGRGLKLTRSTPNGSTLENNGQNRYPKIIQKRYQKHGKTLSRIQGMVPDTRIGGLPLSHIYIYIYIRHRAPRHRGSDTNVLTAPGTGYRFLVSGTVRRSWRSCMTFSASFRHHFLLKIRNDFLHAFGADLEPKLETKAFQNT